MSFLPLNALNEFLTNAVLEKLKKMGKSALNTLLKNIKLSLPSISINIPIQYKSNNGISVGENWQLKALELGRPLTEAESKEMAKFVNLLVETFTKNGGAVKSTAYLELEKNTLVKQARESVGEKTYKFILEKIPVADRSSWLAAMIIKHKQQIGEHNLANLFQVQLNNAKGVTGQVINNLMVSGNLEKMLINNYQNLTANGKEASGEKQFKKLYEQIVYEMPKMTKVGANSITGEMVGKIESDLVKVAPADKTSLQQQIAAAKEKVSQVAQEVPASKTLN